jgi:hypothetical protein
MRRTQAIGTPHQAQLQMKSTTTRPVTADAVIARIRRRLRRDGEILRFPRSERDRFEMGECYIFNDRNCVIASRCTVEGLAAELGLLKPGEVIG